ncbi:MAG: GTPase ObgE [Puniceicoccales bacterium]|jgi:GTP-binding protein|nr:GTPase ObgE [Puniceicoccales bacterium]
MFIDETNVFLKAGNGGHGCLSFRREKFIPKGGPDGGDGGKGGDVVLQCDENEGDLAKYRYQPHWKARNGESGSGRNKHGANGADCILTVPPGTQVVDSATERVIAEVTAHGESVILLNGGKGGLGNCNFKSSVNQAPRKTTPGRIGGDGTFRFVLKTIADIGLVGYPNAGKSTLTGLFTHAHPKVAPYPVTTLHVNVGVIYYEDTHEKIFLADIPGLIEGAHENKGLGHEFLRHIERCRLLLFLVDMAGTDGRKPADDYKSLVKELERYSPALVEKPRLIVANKMDEPAAAKNLTAFKKKHKGDIVGISCLDGTGLEDLKQLLRQHVRARKLKDADDGV